MPIAPISPKVREILKDSTKGRELVREIRKRNPDKNGHVKISTTEKESSGEIRP